MKRFVTISGMIFLSTVLPACTQGTSKDSQDKSSESSAHEDPEGYYTCSMHPEVHQHEPGNCPICGMALIKVFPEKKAAGQKSEASKDIEVSTRQLMLAGIAKHTVSRGDVEVTTPVSGRMTSSREVVFQVFEKDLQTVRVGASFSGATTVNPSDKLEGRIRFIDSIVDPTSRTIRVVGELNRAPQRFVSEGGFHGEIVATEKGQLTVPVDAVLHTGSKSLVYAFSGENSLRPVRVTLGARAGGQYIVLSGLQEGDVVSTGPNFLIDSESKMRGTNDHAYH